MDAGERIAYRKKIFERARHCARASAAGEDERAVDVEEEERQPSLRTLPARGPLADGSSSKLTRWPSFNWSKFPWTELR
jgi:hypothetical protein